jgi:DNA polymerase III alpha subunit (gram-positive type)
VSNDLIFLDTETTGLDPALHEVWEIAYAVNDGPINAYVVTHSLATADPKALELNGYRERGFAFPSGWADVELKAALTGATIVGANPAFDTAFLRARWGVAPWHHRLIDVESMALTVLGYERPKGLHALAADLRDRGHDIPAPDHTAAADVATTRAVYNALRAASA